MFFSLIVKSIKILTQSITRGGGEGVENPETGRRTFNLLTSNLVLLKTVAFCLTFSKSAEFAQQTSRTLVKHNSVSQF